MHKPSSKSTHVIDSGFENLPWLQRAALAQGPLWLEGPVGPSAKRMTSLLTGSLLSSPLSAVINKKNNAEKTVSLHANMR